MCMNNIVILDSEINQAPKLILEDIVGDLLFKKKLLIDASGLNDSLRNMRDGYTFFGSIKEHVINYSFILNRTNLLSMTLLSI